MKCAIYARVSTKEQAEKYSISSQLDRLRSFAEKEGYQVYDEYIDEGYSGTSAERPALRRLLVDAGQGYLDMVLVYQIDRFFRDLRKVLNAVNELTTLGVSFRSITQPFDTSDPAGKFMFQQFASVAEFERNMIVERTNRGKLQSVKEGSYMGRAPYGYYYDEKKKMIHPDKDEAEVVRLIFKLYNQSNTSMYKVADDLNRRGYKTGSGNDWSEPDLQKILSRKTYTGEWEFHSSLEKKPVVVKVPKIVDEETFFTAEELRKRRAKFAKRSTKENYLLAKLIYCGKCGEGMVGYTVFNSPKNDGRSYYRCKRRVYSKSCSMPYIRTERIDRLVWDEIKKVVKKPSLIREAVEQKNAEYERVQQDFRREVCNIDTKVEELQKQKQRVLQAYRRGKLDLDELGNQKQEIQEEENKLNQEREEIKLLVGSERDTRQNLLQLEEFAEKIQDRIDNLNFEQRRYIIELLVKKVLITSEGRVRIDCIVPSVAFVQGERIAEVGSQHGPGRKKKISESVELDFSSSWSPALLIPPGVLPIRTRKTLSLSTVPPWPKSTRQNLTDYGRIGISKALWWTN